MRIDVRLKNLSAALLLVIPYPVIAVGGDSATITQYQQVTPREHSFQETATYLGAYYAATGIVYYLLNTEEISQNFSSDSYLSNVFSVTNFDNDRPTANWVTHVYTGNLAYLAYRARSYTKTDAFLLTALQSALFEFTLETLQEPVSLEDLINTPVFGSILGQSLEHASFPLLNSGSWPLRILGHILNPPTIFGGFYQGTVKITPTLGKITGLVLKVEF